MNARILSLATFSLALFLVLASSVHAASSDVDDLVGERESSGESELRYRGYHHIKDLEVSNSVIGYWWNPRRQACIAVTVRDGRYHSIMSQPELVCDDKGSGSDRHHSDRHGGGTPEIRKVDDGNLAVDMGGCNVLFNPHGHLINKGSSCSDRDVRQAQDAIDGYRNEQGAPAGDEAPPGGFGGHGSGATVTCESRDNGYQYCRHHVGSRGVVRLQRHLSGASCREGSSWGYDDDGVWVDKGCRAVFEIR